MAQPIAPEVWQEGIDDNRLLPNRYTTGLFTGSGVKIANNGEACRVWDIQVTDYITDYDDRRLNGLGNVSGASTFNADGRDGWGASAYGVFQDVRFDSRVYTMGRHRSVAMRVFDEQQYSDTIGQWGTESSSNVMTNGQALMKTAALLSKARDIWEKQVLGPDMDKYNLFAIMSGHISGRLVGKANGGRTAQENTDKVFSGNCEDYEWIAQPGMVQGQPIAPRFAPIHGIEWDETNIPLMLNNVKVTWNNMFIPQENRQVLIDPFYEYQLLSALTGQGVPATEAAYNDLQNGSFTRLMGWEFNFEIPSTYYPTLYFDANLNVVHTATGTAAYERINSVAGKAGDTKLLQELLESDRMNRTNYVRTVWDGSKFKKVVTNYPLGMPAFDGYYGTKATEIGTWNQPYTTGDLYGDTEEKYPWAEPGAGYGLSEPKAAVSPIKPLKVIGCFVYKPAAQLSQEYSEMRTAEGETRGKFTEMVMDVKYDAWVIEALSHGILPIVNATATASNFAIPVKDVTPAAAGSSAGAAGAGA